VAFGQTTVVHSSPEEFNNTVLIRNTLTVDSIKANNGIKTNTLTADTSVVNNGIKTKNLTAENAKINNSLTVGNLTATNFNFSNALNLTGGDLRVGASLNNTNFVLRYKDQASIGALFQFYKGDGVSTGSIVRDASISKMARAPLMISTDAAESITFNTANTERLVIDGMGNVAVKANASTADRLSVEGKLRVVGNALIGSSPTADSLTINGKLNVMGNIGLGTGSSATDRLNIDGNVKINGGQPTVGFVGAYPTIDLNTGGNNGSYPRIHFSGTNVGSIYESNYTTITGEGGGLRIKTSGALGSEALGTLGTTISKQLHTYQAANWTGYAAIESRGLYGGAAYANSIDFATCTRVKMEPDQYTGGLLLGYSDTDWPVRSNYTAAVIKAQYVGTGINSPNQRKFDIVFGINTTGTGTLSFDPVEKMRIKDNGIVNVTKAITINTNLLPSTGNYRLAVGGDIIAEKIVITTLPNWPDYVFKKNYTLTPLSKVEEFIEKNGHLPNVPSAAEVKKDGIELGVMNAKLLEKVEELTLHLINQQKQIDELKNEVKNLKKKD
jgi:hypothetical protein